MTIITIQGSTCCARVPTADMRLFPLMDNHLLSLLSIALYLLAGASLGMRLFATQHALTPQRSLAFSFAAIAAILHAWALVSAMDTSAGINFNISNAVSLTTFVIAVLLIISAISKPIDNLGIVIMPLAGLTLWLQMSYPGEHLLNTNAGWALRLHVVTSMLAYAILTLAAVQALLLSVQDNHLRKHHPGGFIRLLPPLQTMEALLFEMIGVGFVLLCLALSFGFVYLDDMFAQKVAHKTILSIVAWVVFATLLAGRYRFGWRGRTAINWTISGFVILMLAYFGSKVVLELLLGY